MELEFGGEGVPRGRGHVESMFGDVGEEEGWVWGGERAGHLCMKEGGGECGMPLVLYNANQRGRTGRKFVKNLGHHVMERRCAISSIDQS